MLIIASVYPEIYGRKTCWIWDYFARLFKVNPLWNRKMQNVFSRVHTLLLIEFKKSFFFVSSPQWKCTGDTHTEHPNWRLVEACQLTFFMLFILLIFDVNVRNYAMLSTYWMHLRSFWFHITIISKVKYTHLYVKYTLCMHAASWMVPYSQHLCENIKVKNL